MRALALASLLFALSAASLRAQEVIGISVLERGVYTLEVTKTERTPSGIDQGTVANVCRVADTATVPAMQGTQFGLRFRVDGQAPGVPVQILTIVHFPRVVTPPGGQRALSAHEHMATVETGQVSYWGYGLDHPWEVMPGIWTFEMYSGGRKLAEVSFLLVAGVDAPAPRSDGSDCFQMSAVGRAAPRPS